MSNERMYVGTLIGESTSRQFRMAIVSGAVREQDLVAMDVFDEDEQEHLQPKRRIWAKVQRIERLNPMFPLESGHELAHADLDAYDTVLSLSREIVTAVCLIMGAEVLDAFKDSALQRLRYPPKPATRVFRPSSDEIARVVLGALKKQSQRALNIATLSNREAVDVLVDGHAIVTRHLAILAMTGAGKSWSSRRVLEELANKNYPIVIFDPHGDYSGLAKVSSLKDKVKRYYAHFPLFEEDSETVAQIVDSLGYAMTDTMLARFGEVFRAAASFYVEDEDERAERCAWLAQTLGQPEIIQYGLYPNMWLLAHVAAAGELGIREDDDDIKWQLAQWGWSGLELYSGSERRTLEGIKKRAYRAAAVLQRMEKTNRRIAGRAEALPSDRRELVAYGQISIISLAGYTGDFQATIYRMIVNDIFEARISDQLRLPVLFVLEEAHNFASAKAMTPAERRAITITRQVAQEGRKFGVGLLLISQRPSRLDETTLAQCNSYIIMRMVNPTDQTFMRRVIETLGEEEVQMLPELDVGEALLSGQLINFPVLVKMKPPASKGEREEKDAFDALEEARK